jgi:ABC-2 type transport system permease protein
MNVVGMAINNCSLLILWIFFIRTVGGIGGWQQADVVGLEGFTAFAFGIALSFFNGINKIAQTVMNGGFDRYLLSPKNLIVRVATSAFGVSAIGDIIFGIICLTVYACMIHIGIQTLLMLLAGAVIASAICTAVLLASQTVSFWVMDATSITKGFFELFLTPALFVGGAFQGWMRFVFTFAIPSLVMGTLPIEAIKNVSWLGILEIAVLAALFMWLAIALFYKGTRRYESANTGGFGS